MNLTKLFESQKILRDRIGYNEPDRFEKLVLALLVEIGECANEWRGFKFWSKDQKPRTLIYEGLHDGINEPAKNPLLEEYVDGLHFVLEIGIELGHENAEPWRLTGDDVIEAFASIYRAAVHTEIYKDLMNYQRLLSVYIRLGFALGFEWEQIEQAYFAKNQINHERQENGY